MFKFNFFSKEPGFFKVGSRVLFYDFFYWQPYRYRCGEKPLLGQQCCGSGLIESGSGYRSGSSITSESGSGYRPKMTKIDDQKLKIKKWKFSYFFDQQFQFLSTGDQHYIP